MFSQPLHSQIIKWIRLAIELSKIRIAFAVTITVGMGYIMAVGAFQLAMVVPLVGVFILACGSAALNQYQERDLDKGMARTKGRPLPSGRMQPRTVLLMVALFVGVGSLLVYIGGGVIALALGGVTLVWYNGIYTPLKMKTSWAVLPGAVIGALPPVIGWVAAGEHLWDGRIWVLAAFMFVWQVPHFWLIVLMYNRDYENSPFPSVLQDRNPQRVAQQVYLWIAITIGVGLCMPLIWSMPVNWVVGTMVFASLWLMWTSRNILKCQDRKVAKTAFLRVNLYALGMMTLLCAHCLAV